MNKESIALIKRIGDGTFLVYESSENFRYCSNLRNVGCFFITQK